MRQTLRILQPPNNDQTPIMTVARSNNRLRVPLVDELRRGVAVLLQHAVRGERVGDGTEVESVFV